MIFWMAKAARTLSGELRAQIDKAADAGRWSLTIVAMLAVRREGLETALFLWAATQAAAGGTGKTAGPLLGAALGLVLAIVLGYLIYRGALKINLGRFFTWTGAFLIVIAARRPRVRSARPPGGWTTARSEQPGLRCVQCHPADLVVRNGTQGRLQFLARDDGPSGSSRGCCTSSQRSRSSSTRNGSARNLRLPVRPPRPLERPKANDHDSTKPSGRRIRPARTRTPLHLDLRRAGPAAAGGLHQQRPSGEAGCWRRSESSRPDRPGNRHRVQAFRHERPVRSSYLRGDERRQQGERVLPLRPGRTAHRRRSGEYRPGHYAGAGVEGRARKLHLGMQTWHGRRRHPGPILGL